MTATEQPALRSAPGAPAYHPDVVREVEKRLIAASEPDEAMRIAAHAVAEAALTMLRRSARGNEEDAPRRGRVLVLAGRGGNGGDGLFAGAEIAAACGGVMALDAVAVTGATYDPAREAFQAAGGQFIGDQEALERAQAGAYMLVIDAIAGLGSGRPLDGLAAAILSAHAGEVLSVDVPSGVSAATGRASDNAVRADVTVTFGAPRTGHASAHTGTLLIADIRSAGGFSFAEALAQECPAAYLACEQPLGARWQFPAALATLPGVGPLPDVRPGAFDDKYSGGVVGIAAGSEEYPGAGLLCAGAAVGATPAMVRAVATGWRARALIARHPEVVLHPTVAAAGRAQCWVVGPGSGVAAGDLLGAALERQAPVVIDAAALRALAESTPRGESLRARVKAGRAVLTPHAGEFRSLAQAYGLKGPGDGPLSAAQELADTAGAVVLLKGRVTIIAAPGQTPIAIDAGHSLSATPGTGDVLAGMLGALVAREETRGGQSWGALAAAATTAVALHAWAMALGAMTPAGLGIASASGSVACINHAWVLRGEG